MRLNEKNRENAELKICYNATILISDFGTTHHWIPKLECDYLTQQYLLKI